MQHPLSPFKPPPSALPPLAATAHGARAVLHFLLLISGAILIGLGALGWHSWAKGQELRERTGQSMKGMAHVIAEQSARTVQTIDLTLQSVLDALRYNQIDWHLDSLHIYDYLKIKQDRSDIIRNLFVIDERGILLNESANYPPSDLVLNDRPYFIMQRHSPDLGLYIGPPMLSRITNDWIIAASRRIEKPNGDFDGVVVASSDLTRLRSVLDSANLGEGAEIALFLANGNLLVRSPQAGATTDSPFLSAEMMARAEGGKAIFTSASPIDGVRRIYALHRVPDMPIYVLAGMDEKRVLHSWQREWMMLTGISALIVAAIGLFGILAWRGSRRRDNLLAALSESEQVFRDFAEAASDRFWQSDAEHRLIWHSGIVGTPLPSYIGKTRWDNLGIDPNHNPAWLRLKADMDAHRSFRDFRYARPKPDGSVHHRIVSGKPVYDGHGTFLGYRGTYNDITAQVTTQERAQRSRDRFLRAIESLSEGFALYDADDRLVVCNRRFQELYAPAANSLVRWSSFEDLLRECVEKQLIPEAIGQEEDWVMRRMAQHHDLPHVQEVERKGRWVEIREQPDKEGGTLILVLDIHEQKVAELRRQALATRLRTMIDNMPLGCLLLDSQRRILDWNPAAEQIFGYSKAEALGIDSLDLIVAPDQRAEIADSIARACSGEDTTSHISFNRTKDGRGIYCEWVNTRLIDNDGNFAGLVSMVRDVSAKRSAEEKLRQATRMEAIGQLTGGIAHDFNNLLQVIIGNSEILIESLEDSPRLQRWANMTKKAADRGAELTLRLLAYSRRQTLEPVSVDLNEVISELRPLIGRAIGDDVAITTAMAEELWESTLDRGQIDQALLNIVLNARDAMPNGGSLTIATSNASLNQADAQGDEKSGDFVAITVTDSGSGMTPDVLKRAFEPFFSTKGVGKGSGLGLSMVHGFVNQSGGLVRLESELGKGTTVRIYFPRAAAKDAAKPPSETAAPQTSGKTILVVEDNDMVRAYVTAQLESLGYNVLEAENGPAGLAQLESADQIDLLFTDIIMPGGINGRELAERAVAQQPHLRVLFTSGYDESAITTDGHLAAGMYLLKKPYQRKDLASKISEVLNAAATAAA
jgi:PAS domain S-box-containing protein